MHDVWVAVKVEVGGRLTHAGGLAHPFSPSFPSLVPLLVISQEEKGEAEARRCRFVTGSELDGPSFFLVPPPLLLR